MYKLIDLTSMKPMDVEFEDGVLSDLETAEVYAIGLFQDTTPIGIYPVDADVNVACPDTIIFAGTVYSA